MHGFGACMIDYLENTGYYRIKLSILELLKSCTYHYKLDNFSIHKYFSDDISGDSNKHDF